MAQHINNLNILIIQKMWLSYADVLLFAIIQFSW